MMKKEIAQYQARLGSLESGIPRESGLDRFLFFLTQEKYSSGIEFIKITPAQKKGGSAKGKGKSLEQAGYRVRHYEMEIRGSYAKLVAYLDYLDHISSYAAVSSVTIGNVTEDRRLNAMVRFSIMISQAKGGTDSNKGGFTVDYSSNLSVSGFPFWYEPPENKDTPIIEEIVVEDSVPEFPVSGVIRVGKEYRVIVNEQIFREGDLLENFRIEKIQHDKIVLQSEGKIYDVPVK